MAIIKKICLLGNPGVGKTSLINRYVYNMFSDKYISTIGTRVSRKDISVDSKLITMMIWDLLGEKEFRILHTSALKGTSGALLVCDVKDEKSINDLEYWKNTVTEAAGKIPLLVLANKVDLIDTEISIEINLPYMFTSAKTGENVEKAFMTLAKMMLEAMK